MRRFFLFVLLAGIPFQADAGALPNGEVKREVEKFVNDLYLFVERLKDNGFKQYLYYQSQVKEVEKPLPVKKPDYDELQKRYLEKLLSSRGER